MRGARGFRLRRRAAKAAGARVIGFTGGGHTWLGHADVLTEAGAETVINRSPTCRQWRRR